MLGFGLNGLDPDEMDVMASVQDYMTKNPHLQNRCTIFISNPCDFDDWYFTSIKSGVYNGT